MSAKDERNRAMARYAASLAEAGYTTREIAAAIGKKPEQVKAIVSLGQRLKERTRA